MSPTPSRLYPEHTTSREPVRAPEPTIGELISDLRQEMTELFRKEVQLARLEISTAISRLMTGVSVSAFGGVLAFAGLLFLLAAAAFGLDAQLQRPWLSTLIVGAATIVIGAACVAIGKTKFAHLAPEHTLHSLKQDTELVKEHLPGGGT